MAQAKRSSAPYGYHPGESLPIYDAEAIRNLEVSRLDSMAWATSTHLSSDEGTSISLSWKKSFSAVSSCAKEHKHCHQAGRNYGPGAFPSLGGKGSRIRGGSDQRDGRVVANLRRESASFEIEAILRSGSMSSTKGSSCQANDRLRMPGVVMYKIRVGGHHWGA